MFDAQKHDWLPPIDHLGVRHPLSDAYQQVFDLSWGRLFLGIAATYVLYNALFATLYLAGGDCIDAKDPSSFLLAFSFSVQTMTSTGYGAMHPTTSWAHLLTIIEAFGGLLGIAMATGLMFAKFSRPVARVAFSRNILITQFQGKRVLQFRMANTRNSQVVDARVTVNALISTETAEGTPMTRLIRLPLMRSDSPMFRLSWTVIHFIDEDSPLFGITPENLHERITAVSANLVGLDDLFAQTVHAQWGWRRDSILFDHQFEDMVSGEMGDRLVIDHSRLHDVRPTG